MKIITYRCTTEGPGAPERLACCGERVADGCACGESAPPAISAAERQRRAGMKTPGTGRRRTAVPPPDSYRRAARKEVPLHNGCPSGYDLSAIPDYGRRQIPAASLMDTRMAPTEEARRAARPPDPYKIRREARVRGSEAAA